jgi:hypothetical protein
VLPSDVGKLVALAELGIQNNDFSGPIPTETGTLTKLGFLNARENNLPVIIPSEVGQLIALRQLSIGTNFLNGAIPSETGQLTNLEHLQI